MAKRDRKKEPARPAPRVYSARVKAGIILVLCIALASVIALFRQQAEAGQDVTSLNEKRFEGIRKALPPRATVGYVSDIGGENPGAYYLTQYFLAPVLVSPQPDQELVVGNFSAAQRIPAILEKHNLAVVQDFQNGVLLLRKVRR